jgi:hypothetical protein
MTKALGVLAVAVLLGQERLDLPERWVYCSYNLWVDQNLDALGDIFRRAAKSGYTGILLADSKFHKLGDMDARYFKNVERIKKEAAGLKLKIIPAVFPIGYSEGILWHDPNLAEGLPVQGALFEVRGGAARLVQDSPARLKEKWDWKDPTVGDDLTVTDPHGKLARVSQKVGVKPFRQYHLSVRVRTSEFRGTPQVTILAGRRSLNHAELGVKPTQDWTLHHVVFNSLDHEEIGVYLGCWDGKTGTLQWADPKLEEVGLVNLIRREGAPLRVTRETGEALEEGKDFERVVDPRMGAHPWRGAFDVYHEPPTIKTALPDGTRLRVSYYHAITVHQGQVMICPSESKTVELLRDEAKRIHAAWGAKGYFMSHDEIRVLNWDDSCTRRKLDAGAILADNVRTCASILREINPGGEIYVWSDMFDPFHNAHDDYYLVRGDLKGSWEGLDKDVIVAAWYYGKRNESLNFFSGRGNRTLCAGYYDHDPEQVTGWLEAGKKVKGCIGVMYTTWEHKFGDLEKFAEVVERSR